MAQVAKPTTSGSNTKFQDKEKPMEVRMSNITAAKAVGDAIRTSLGPRGMDKMVNTFLLYFNVKTFNHLIFKDSNW
jgi:T-complex protein 1 subunit delta